MANVVEPNQPETDEAGEDVLRSAFVEMLFALAASQVAIHAADLVGVDVPWQTKLPAFAHLGVGFVLIVASWLGWRQSVAPGMKERVRYPFSVPFIGLLVDVLLVILYFIIILSWPSAYRFPLLAGLSA
jgi:amino acid transporter